MIMNKIDFLFYNLYYHNISYNMYGYNIYEDNYYEITANIVLYKDSLESKELKFSEVSDIVRNVVISGLKDHINYCCKGASNINTSNEGIIQFYIFDNVLDNIDGLEGYFEKEISFGINDEGNLIKEKYLISMNDFLIDDKSIDEFTANLNWDRPIF